MEETRNNYLEIQHYTKTRYANLYNHHFLPIFALTRITSMTTSFTNG